MIALLRVFFVFTLIGVSFILFVGYVIRPKSREEDTTDPIAEDLKRRIEDVVQVLIPIDIHELKILGWEKSVLKKSRSEESGFFSTIFQEKLISYIVSKKSYRTAAIAKTSNHTYLSIKSSDNTKLILSGELWGTIDNNLVLQQLDKAETFEISAEGGEEGIISKSGVEIVRYRKGKVLDGDRFFQVINELKENDKDAILFMSLYVLLLEQE